MRSFAACLTAALLLPVSAASAAPPRSLTSLSAKQKHVEQRLQEPAHIDIAGRESITIGELLEQIREEHGVRVQLYRGTAMLTLLCLNGFDQSGSPRAYGSVAANVPGAVIRQDAQYVPLGSVAAPAPVVPITSGASPAGKSPSSVVPAPPTPEPIAPPTPDNGADSELTAPGIRQCEEQFRSFSVSTTTLHGDLTVEDALRAVIAQIPTPLDIEEMAGLPLAYTHAYDWDLLIRGDGVYITTVTQTNLHKIARVYRVPAGGDFTPEELAEVVRRTIRPWSWRDQIDEVVNRVQIDVPPGAMLPSMTQMPELVTSNVIGTSVVPAASEGASTTPEDDSRTTIVPPEASWLSIKALGSLISSGTIAAAHAMINFAELLHYADPPTATIEVLPGMLIISQSHSAHREIADLLEQIGAVTTAE